MRRHYRITRLYLGLGVLLGVASLEAQVPLSVKAAALYSKNNMPPLYQAAIAGDVNTVQKLIAQGVDINEQLPTSGATALDGAVMRNKTAVVKELINAGARKDIANKEGKTPLELAQELDRTDIVPLLQ